MNANELRIGNLFNPLNTSGQIHLPEKTVIKIGMIGFFDVSVCEYSLPFASADLFELPIRRLSPIPLTEEWLLKFGFECIGKETDYEMFCIGYIENDSHEGIGSYSCSFELNKNDDGSFHLELSSIDVKYVHQLQNLYFALTEEELAINQGYVPQDSSENITLD